MFIDQAFSLLADIHQALFADAVDTPRDPGRFFIDIVQCPVCKDILPSPGIGWDCKGAGEMTFRELCSKEVVQLKDGACLGRVDDVELDADTARIGSLLLLGRPRLFGLLGRDETLTIPWADIERIGLDAILVRTDIPAPPPSHGGLLDKLHQWLNG